MNIFLHAAISLCFLSLILNIFQMLDEFSNERQGAITLIHAVAILMVVFYHITQATN